MKEWQFNVLFFVGVGGAVLLLIGPEIGLDLAKQPTALTGVGAILTYVLTQRFSLPAKNEKKKARGKEESTPDKKEVDNGL